ncbi:hypothetical protein [Hydrogenophaga sp. ZJX-1]|uniref:hypothetical protein n=1 Tax=Hydrogenophaga sp. ZJX-1 TaxID=3404778 RepID=UPI003B289130
MSLHRSPKDRAKAAWIGTTLLALLAATPSPNATAQSRPTPPAAACTEPADMAPAHLYGLWQLTLWPLDGRETEPQSRGAVLFERHPDYPGSVRGHIRRSTTGNDVQTQVSGDVVDGEFNLDESADGVTMEAVWAGAPLACGQVIRGIRRPAEGSATSQPSLYFRLDKTPGWR